MFLNTKTQVSLNFENDMLLLMKQRAKSLNRSFNNYVLNLAKEDLVRADILPKVELTDDICDYIHRLAGNECHLPSAEELEDDPRLENIWIR